MRKSLDADSAKDFDPIATPKENVFGSKISYRLIADTLYELLKQKLYIDITVSELIQAADVARVSFYRNFNSISDVLDYIADGISEGMIHDVFPVLVSNDEKEWRAFLFEHFYRIMKNKGEIETLRYENFAVLRSRMSEKMQRYDRELPDGTLQEKYAAFGKMGLIINIDMKWIGEGMKETPEEMVDYIMSFILLF